MSDLELQQQEASQPTPSEKEISKKNNSLEIRTKIGLVFGILAPNINNAVISLTIKNYEIGTMQNGEFLQIGERT